MSDICSNRIISSYELEPVCDGVWKAPGARIIDRSGKKRMPIGRDGFVNAMETGVIVDKTMLIADVLNNSFAATLFCRPRRFGKTLNMTMMKAFFESPEAGGLSPDDVERVFAGTEIWEADDGAWREQQGGWPVVHVSFNTVKKATWEDSLAAIRAVVTAEYQRHAYLLEGETLPPGEAGYFEKIMSGEASDADYADSLIRLTRALKECHGTGVVILIDEYDAPVMAGYTNGYYDEVVGFLKGWLTGALKDGGEALAFACLTGVQRISKESVFSDLNNLYVSTPLEDDFDERYGFRETEVTALATYLGHPDCMPEAREWYDGYHFGDSDVYNPWSVINYLNKGCRPGVYWGNTSSNSVVGELIASADVETLEDVYGLLRPGGTVRARLDLGIVFPDLGVREGALWSMLYLSGYLTTDDVEDPSNEMLPRELRVPDKEIARIFENEVLRRFLGVAGGERGLDALHRALLEGDEERFGDALSKAAQQASTFDLTGELPCHMLLMGLLFGVEGYKSPLSNREAGYGRYDIRLEPDPHARGRAAKRPRPLITLAIKFEKAADEKGLVELAHEALGQIAEKGYDAELPSCAEGRVRWGVAFSGKRVGVACERV